MHLATCLSLISSIKILSIYRVITVPDNVMRTLSPSSNPLKPIKVLCKTIKVLLLCSPFMCANCSLQCTKNLPKVIKPEAKFSTTVNRPALSVCGKTIKHKEPVKLGALVRSRGWQASSGILS